MSSVGRFARSVFLSETYRTVMDTVDAKIPMVRKWRCFEYDEHFARRSQWARKFNGVYASFEEARQAIPAAAVEGYDNPGSGNMFEDPRRVYPSDYPVMFWMGRILPDLRRVFDFGGHVGLSYYAYRQYLPYPKGLEWTICDVAEVVRAGRELAGNESAQGLHFTTSFEDAEGADLLLAAGSLQFVEEPLAERLGALRSKPAHVVINKVPLADGEPFVTLQNIGPAICPYRIFNRDDFRRGMEQVGYEVVDEWANPDLGCYIPYHADRIVHAFSGMYLRLR